MTTSQGRKPTAVVALATLTLIAALVATDGAEAKKKGGSSIGGTYEATTDDGFPVSVKVSKKGVISSLQLQMTVYGKGCGTSRVATVPAPIKLKRSTRSKREGEYHGPDADGQNALDVTLKLDVGSGKLKGTVKTESTVLFDPVDHYALCFGQTAFKAKR
jgi:hypothetical protein